MQFKKIHPNFELPIKGSEAAGGYDLFMPERGTLSRLESHKIVGLGFAAAVPEGHVALILPRSSTGAKHGVNLRNVVGVIDADYRGEWAVAIRQTEKGSLSWAAGERLFQFIVVPVANFVPELVDELPATQRGEGGFGSTGTAQVVQQPTQEPESQPEEETETTETEEVTE